MNAVLFSFMGFLALSSHALAMVCSPSACFGVKCEAVTEENCDGVIVPNGGVCGWCDACNKIIREGENCGYLFIHGPLPFAQCDTGLVCSSTTFKCEQIVPV